MKYQPPWGISDPNAPYINGDPAQGRQGSIPPAAAFEQPQREIVGVIEKSGFISSDLDLLQLAKGVRSQRLNYAIDTGTPNNVVVAFDPPFQPGTNPYTQGLTLRVRVRFNTIDLGGGNGQTNINAGAGTVRIRRMNGFDLLPGDLQQGAIITLVYDGTVFQLTNFGGGGGGDVTYEGVNIPYANDLSPSPGEIWADFAPEIVAVTAGDIFAVKIAHTAPGATRMRINTLGFFDLQPNGGDLMLQGDLAEGDVVQFFYDGVALRFAPNPEITAPVIYGIGSTAVPGAAGQFATFDDAMNAIRRKMIGANGYVTLKFGVNASGGGADPTQPIMGPLNISHPSGDRLAIVGTMINTPPQVTDFQRTGNSQAQRDNDAIFNRSMLRSRYGTEITIPDRQPGDPFVAGERWNGVTNLGAGEPLIADLLFVGTRRPNDAPSGWDQNGVHCGLGASMRARNVSVYGSQMGFSSSGALYCEWCFSCANTLSGFQSAGASVWYRRTGAFGNQNAGYFAEFSTTWADHATAEVNGNLGWQASNSAPLQMYFCRAQSNGGQDVSASVGCTVILVTPSDYGQTSPPVSSGTISNVGNFNSIIVAVPGVDPGPPINSPQPPQPPLAQSQALLRQMDFASLVP